jgi:hypothetical protein
MTKLIPKPPGSTINVENDFGRTVLSWKNPSGGGIRRFATLIFLVAWMGGWAFGEFTVLTQLLSRGGNLFLLFWLIAWTVGGFFCAVTIARLARPARPERLTLDQLNLSYEPGTDRMIWKEESARNPWEMLKPKKACTVAKKDIGEIRIDRVGERQRLSFDYGAKRVEVGQYLEEPEREWLLQVLKSWKSV